MILESVIVYLNHGFTRTCCLPQLVGCRRLFFSYILEYLIVSFDELFFPEVRPSLLYLLLSIVCLIVFDFYVDFHC